jgi:hypothetical protein
MFGNTNEKSIITEINYAVNDKNQDFFLSSIKPWRLTRVKGIFFQV